ncbi:hypothetical protein QF028_000800 [Neobacillus sp. B4I6]
MLFLHFRQEEQMPFPCHCTKISGARAPYPRFSEDKVGRHGSKYR